MTYGVPEMGFGAVEHQNAGAFKCVGCAAEGLDAEWPSIYMLHGTTYCFRHVSVQITAGRA